MIFVDSLQPPPCWAVLTCSLSPRFCLFFSSVPLSWFPPADFFPRFQLCVSRRCILGSVMIIFLSFFPMHGLRDMNAEILRRISSPFFPGFGFPRSPCEEKHGCAQFLHIRHTPPTGWVLLFVFFSCSALFFLFLFVFFSCSLLNRPAGFSVPAYLCIVHPHPHTVDPARPPLTARLLVTSRLYGFRLP